MLGRRLVSASALLAFVLACIGLDLWRPMAGVPGWWMLPVYFLLVLGTVREMSELLAARWSIDPKRVLMGAAVAASAPLFPMVYTTCMGRGYPADCPVGSFGWIVLGMVLAMLLLGCDALLQFSKVTVDASEGGPERVALGWLLSVSILAYVVMPMSLWWLIRQHGSSSQGMANMVGIALVTKMADTGAYFFGKLFGRTKLCPAISPGKTIEGLLGGIAVACVACFVFFRLLVPALGLPFGNTGWWGPCLLALLLAVGGLVGDLIESMIKRSVGKKDSGNQLPGLGGVWDVTDSLIPAAALGYLGILFGLN